MTKENRENAYKHFRNLEKTYEALPHEASGITSTKMVRARAKKNADNLIQTYPDLETPIVKEVKTKKEVKDGRQREELTSN